MREILFRAKIKDADEWVEGYYAMMGKENLIRHYIVQNCALTGLFSDPEENMYFNDVEIDPETLCQYTGLKDRNGNRIWENDICTLITEEGEFVIKYDEEGARFILDGDGIVGDFDNYYDYECEVIGNIFDNPELLKGE